MLKNYFIEIAFFAFFERCCSAIYATVAWLRLPKPDRFTDDASNAKAAIMIDIFFIFILFIKINDYFHCCSAILIDILVGIVIILERESV